MATSSLHLSAELLCIVVFVVILINKIQAKTLWGKPQPFPDNEKYPLIVISFDGFRWDYLNRTSTPNFDIFLENGVTARYGLRNAFVTKTFPNHFTLATGMWEESHGIVANDMYDPVLNQTFSPKNISATHDPAWFNVGSEPIWVTNQLQSQNGRSGIIMWVGGGAPIKWVTPTRFIQYDKTIKNETKIDMLIDWLTDKYPINLGMIYFDEPDGFGHKYGPDSPQVTGMIAGLDEVVGYLLKRLKEKGLMDRVNIILTSDHGFTNTPADKKINLDDFIHPDSYYLSAQSPIASIWPHEDKFDEVYQNLTAGAQLTGNFTVYKREDVPAHFHYSNNRRIPPILAVAYDTFHFCTGECVPWQLGDHGYDNRLQDMHPFFVAMGPSFKKNVYVDSFNSVDVYPLMCHLLGLDPAPNNGSLYIVSDLLVQRVEDSRIIIVTYTLVAMLLMLVAGVFVVSICRFFHRSKYIQQGEYSSIITAIESAGKNNRNSGAVPISPESPQLSDSRVPLLQNQDDVS